MNRWCLWRAEQFRKSGDTASASQWERRADSEPGPNPEFRWPNGFNRASAVAHVQKHAQPGMPDDASDFWVLGALNTLLGSRRVDAGRPLGGGGHPIGGGGPGYNPYRNNGRFAPGPHHDRRVTSGGGSSNNLHDHMAALEVGKAAHAKSAIANGMGHSAGAANAHREAGHAHNDAVSAHNDLGNHEISKAHQMARNEHHDKADYIEAKVKATDASARAHAAGTSDAHYEAYQAHQKIADRMEGKVSKDVLAQHKAAAREHFDTSDRLMGHREPSKYR